jgi:hypothetical protein
MRIERLQHARDRAIDQPVGLDVADVVLLDGPERRPEDLVLVRHLVLRRQGAPAEEAAGQGAKHNGEYRSRDGPVSVHGY